MNDIIGLDKIYLIHHKPMVSRGDYMRKRLSEEGIEVEWVECFPPEEIDYEKELKDWEKFEDVEILQPYHNYHNFSKKISIGSLSLVLKHKWCFQNQLENNYENVLIIEDDLDIPKNFKTYLNNNMKDFLELKENENVQMLSIGMSHHFLTKNYKAGKYAHYGENQKVRCTHAIVYNIEATKKILPRFNIINLPIDFKLNEIIQVENLKVAWSEPGLFQNPR